ncbi:MAG TPA: hypothetical protein PKW06_04660 [Cyclobacteriaceae bacterium]|nr:hypothetical protein [Cyclobacteriaceae bacterium]MCB9237512.1 hypothetical protein [Flammeovirgaceae bacterium]MCB0500317.1 hypothetical protein [Cyclobacteriaceae bacterium]MCO5270385.1 hypothetical protein [Cyclobacteriaceae bacterium]MCW5903556.1 hypothetical protein [Cyclobacteriaceae bacterium]
MPACHKIVAIISLLLVGAASFAQTQDSYDYNSEFTWGVNKNTSGGLIGGFVFKKARKLTERTLETFGLEIMNVKHPQENRLSSGTGNYFIYGKSNYLYSFRFQYGRDLIIFKKAPQQGVEIKAVVAAGPSVGVVAPYFIERAIDNSFFATKHEQYDPNNPFHSYNKILGTGYLFEGLGKSKLQLGGNVKAGFNFELGTVKSQVTGFEVGFLLDAYFNKVILMPTTNNSSVFPTLYFTLFYGSRK